MTWTAQWRTKAHLVDAIFVVDDDRSACNFIPATPLVLSHFLTDMADLAPTSHTSTEPETCDPDGWGELVLARGSSGEVLEVEPELFWHGIYAWFRSRGIDYDTPSLQEGIPLREVPDVPLSSLMDD